MSNYHVLEINERKKDRARVAFHFAVPAEQNVATKDLSDCYAEHEGPLTSVVPDLGTTDATELAAIVAGTVIERVETVQYDANAANAAKLAVVEARWTTLNGQIADIVRERYKFWGYNADVP